ncbi:hypothetical protein MKX01_010573 [Papaver californicum]|nr:hypothetical protein MKX01_010573 [Papaver californicum]
MAYPTFPWNYAFQITCPGRFQFSTFVAAHCAGIGVLNVARQTMSRMSGNNEASFEIARSQFWVVDANMHCHLQGQSKNLVPWGYNQDQAL